MISMFSADQNAIFQSISLSPYTRFPQPTVDDSEVLKQFGGFKGIPTEHVPLSRSRTAQDARVFSSSGSLAKVSQEVSRPGPFDV